MKQAMMLAVLATCLLGSCAKDEQPQQTRPAQVNGAAQTTISATAIRMENANIVLPAGTKVTRSADELELDFTLPEGYAFLTDGPVGPSVDGATAYRPLPVLPKIATYKCHCSSTAGSNCMVFYQEDAGGFGCLHKSCTGSCTGSFVTSSGNVIGVIDQRKKDILQQASQFTEGINLDSLGWSVFLSNPTVQSKIAAVYAQVYRHRAKPDFDQIETGPALRRQYVHQKVQLYGVSFYLLVPATDAALRTENVYAPVGASCSCTGPAGKCEKKSKGFLGYRIYWCEGNCNGCALSIN